MTFDGLLYGKKSEGMEGHQVFYDAACPALDISREWGREYLIIITWVGKAREAAEGLLTGISQILELADCAV